MRARSLVLLHRRRQRALAEAVADQRLGERPAVLRHDQAVMHVPIEAAARGRGAAATPWRRRVRHGRRRLHTGLAKAIALTTGLPIVAVPTTYAGSEATTSGA